MTHQEIEQREMVEGYVRGQLAPEERRAFQEHFFTCDECFAQVQLTERFISGVRHAAAAGLLGPEPADQSGASAVLAWWSWSRPAVAMTAAAVLVLAAVTGWLLFYKMPRLRAELARERQAHEQREKENQQSLNRAEEQIRLEREARAELESQLEQQARAKSETQIALTAIPEPNVPLVMLEASRGAQAPTPEFTLPAGARSLVLWIEVEPSARFSSFRLQIYTLENRLVQTVEGLKKNAYGALAVGLPARAFQAGKYVVKLYGLDKQQSVLVGEYRLQIKNR